MIQPGHSSNGPRVTTALLLAAGTGSRLKPLTLDAPKCLTEVGGTSILERLIENLLAQGFKRLVVATGHLENHIQEFLQQYATNLQIDYVFNPDYQTTNNIYSLWLARKQIHEPFLLVESDLVFETRMLDDMLYPDKMAISKMLPWMNGTTVELKPGRQVAAFRMGDEVRDNDRQYKGVNIYSLSLSSWRKVEARLARFISEGRVNEYYEAVFAEMVADGSLSFNVVFFEAGQWYEIDTSKDLVEAEKLFALPRSLLVPPLSQTPQNI